LNPPHGKKKRTDAGQAAVSIVFAVGAIVALNVIAARVTARVDLTEDHIYTLSPASKELVRSLPDYLTVKAYISGDLPAELAAVGRYARDLLDELRAASGGKLRFTAHDPAGDPAVEEQATRCRIGKVAVQVRRSEKMEVGRHYLGLCASYNGVNRPLMLTDQTAGLEYQILALIKSMTETKRKIAFTSGHGERDLGHGYSFIKRGLDEQFVVVTLNPSVNEPSDDVDLLVIAGPRLPFDERARRAIDGFIMQGKPALFLVDGMEAVKTDREGHDDEVVGRAIDSGLDPLLQAYGFRIGRNLVFDRVNVPGPVQWAGRTLIANLPAFVQAKPEPVAAKELSVLAGINVVVFPFASSVERVRTSAGAAQVPGQVWMLAGTSHDGWKATGTFSLSPEAANAAADGASQNGGDRGPLPLAYAYRGVLSSAYPPVAIVAAPGGKALGGEAARSRKPVRLVVIGDTDFAADDYMELLRSFPVYAGGPQMLWNAINWAVEDDALTILRAGILKSRPIEMVSAERGDWVKWGNVAGVPAALCAAGLLRWKRRLVGRRRQKLDGDGSRP
jgi:ABC-type uncharacterized transport system involved in gliding motility auxiliary subunit